MDNLINNLDMVNWKVDYFISHTAPSKVIKEINSTYDTDILTDFLDTIEDKLEYTKWYYGHMHHYHKSSLTKSSCQCLYYDLLELGE